jgi:hypothetical protein
VAGGGGGFGGQHGARRLQQHHMQPHHHNHRQQQNYFPPAYRFCILYSLLISIPYCPYVNNNRVSCVTYSNTIIGTDGIRAGRPGFDSRQGQQISTASRPIVGPTQPPIQRVLGPLSPGVKWPGLESDHSPPTSAEVKKTWIYTSTPPYAFMV